MSAMAVFVSAIAFTFHEVLTIEDPGARAKRAIGIQITTICNSTINDRNRYARPVPPSLPRRTGVDGCNAVVKRTFQRTIRRDI